MNEDEQYLYWKLITLPSDLDPKGCLHQGKAYKDR